MLKTLLHNAGMVVLIVGTFAAGASTGRYGTAQAQTAPTGDSPFVALDAQGALVCTPDTLHAIIKRHKARGIWVTDPERGRFYIVTIQEMQK